MSNDAIDMKEVMERVQDDRELLIELVQIFTDDYAEKKQTLALVVAKNDFDQVKNISHAMKGAAGNISAKKIRVSFLELEQMAKDKDLSRAQPVLNAIEEQFKELKDFAARTLTK